MANNERQESGIRFPPIIVGMLTILGVTLFSTSESLRVAGLTIISLALMLGAFQSARERDDRPNLVACVLATLCAATALLVTSALMLIV